MDPSSAAVVTEARLRLSKAPSAELAAAALEATNKAGLSGAADFIVVAVPSGTGLATAPAVAAAAAGVQVAGQDRRVH